MEAGGGEEHLSGDQGGGLGGGGVGRVHLLCAERLLGALCIWEGHRNWHNEGFGQVCARVRLQHVCV